MLSVNKNALVRNGIICHVLIKKEQVLEWEEWCVLKDYSKNIGNLLVGKVPLMVVVLLVNVVLVVIMAL